MVGTSEVFLRCVSRKGLLNEGWECGCLRYVTIIESLEPSVWVVLMYASRERGEEVMG